MGKLKNDLPAARRAARINMTNHPNRNWRRRWKVDLAGCTATHQDGWVFAFALAKGDNAAWDGKLIAQPQLPDPLPPGFAKTAARIAKEAGDLYMEALHGRH
jgi:hypothetical protein